MTGHKERALESETGSFDECTGVIQVRKLCETNTWKGTTTNFNISGTQGTG